MNNTAKLSKKFQITIPKAVRERYQWKPGQELALIPKGNSLLLMPIPTLEDLRGIAKGAKREGYRDRNDRY